MLGSRIWKGTRFATAVAVAQLTLFSVLPAGALAQTQSTSIPVTNTTLSAPRVVNVQQLPATATSAHPKLAHPFRARDLGSYQAAKTQANAARGQGAAGTLAAASVQTHFPLMNLVSGYQQFGSDQLVEPPDTMLAAGPTSLLETINSNGTVWSKTGTQLKGFDLNTFFGVPSGYSFSDPRVLYDAPSGRWFVSGLSFDSSNDSQVYVAVSQTSDPTGAWNVYTVASNTSQTIYDQPKLGVSNDKVVLSWNDYPRGLLFSGAETWVLQKSDLLNGTAPRASSTGPDKNRFSIVPAQSLTSTSTEYLVYNNADPKLNQNTPQPTVGVIAVTGTPANNDVAFNEVDLPVAATSIPPAATQPGGTITTNDDRFLSAVWQNGMLWVSGNTGCTPTGGTSVRSCLRLTEVNTTTTSPTLVQSFNYGFKNVDVYYPAVALDSVGNLFVSFTGSSSKAYPSSAYAVQPASGTTGTLVSPGIFQKGTGFYKGSRWGDYSAAAVDPSTPSTVWVTSEYSITSGKYLGDWGTATAQVTLPGT